MMPFNHTQKTQLMVILGFPRQERFLKLPLSVPTAGLNVEVSELQWSLLNPTSWDMIDSDIIDQAKGEMENNKEAKRKQCFMTGNTNSYSIILNY